MYFATIICKCEIKWAYRHTERDSYGHFDPSPKFKAIRIHFNQHRLKLTIDSSWRNKQGATLPSRVRFWVEYHFQVATLWGFIRSSMQHLADHVHEWCLSMQIHKDSQQPDAHPIDIQFAVKNNNWIWVKKQTNKHKGLINLPKTRRTNIFHNLLNLDTMKDIQLLQSWSVLGYFLSYLSIF